MSVLPDGYWQSKSHSLHITFDDGPNPQTTEGLVLTLSELGVKGTFFFTGENARRYPHLVKMAFDHGHVVGNHSYFHTLSYSENSKSFLKGIQLTNKIIEQTTGVKPKVYRPPFGIIDQKRAKLIKDLDMELVYWGALAEDWLNLGEAEVVRRIINQLEPGTIIVLHESSTNRAQCLNSTRTIVERAKMEGYQFEAIQPVKA